MKNEPASDKDQLLNRDPITKEPGAHPVGTGVGAAAAGAAGAAIGMAAGPVGAVVGATVGSIMGGLAGKDIAEGINPTIEDAYWRENYSKEDYVEPGVPYEEYQPAYRIGYEGYARHKENFDAGEEEFRQAWENSKGNSRLQWDRPRLATYAGWKRVAIASADTVKLNPKAP